MQNKKWWVLIVDDEFRIGRLIKKLIHWDEFALECVDVVDNGGTAFEIIQSVRCPDVVITDIRMPKINGLELIAMTREIHKNMKFVVISGYKEFEYAHQALQYGVEDYLLKPVNEEELNRVLKKISDELTAQWRSEREHQILKETISESRHIIKRDFLKNIIETEEPEEVDDRVEFQGEIYRGMDIKLDYVDYNKKDKKQDKLTITRIEEIVERILKVDTEEVLLCEKENLHIYCLFNYDFSKKKNIKNSKILGIKVDRIRVMIYSIVGFISALAGLLYVCRLGSAQTAIGEDWPMNSIAASVIGGVALTGGVGNPAGALIGAAVITIIQNIIVLFGVNSYWQSAVSGIVVVLAISFSSISTIVRENRQKRIKLN